MTAKGERDTVVERLKLGDFLFRCVDTFDDGLKHPLAILRAHLWPRPFVEGTPCRRDGLFNSARASIGEIGDHFIGAGVHLVEPLIVPRAPLAIDQ